MRSSAGANASSLAWRSDKKMTVPGLLGGTVCQGPAGMLVAAYFDFVPTRRLPSLGFGARLGLATSALVVLVCIAQSWILAERGLDHVRRQLIETGRNASEQLASEVGALILSGNLDRLRELAGHARARSGVQYARFFDRHGLLLVSAGDPPTGTPPPGAAAAPAGPIAVGADLWEFQAPILVAEPRPRHGPATLVAGERAGTVAVGVSLEALHALRRRTFATATLFAVLFTPIAALGAILLTRAITRPLTVLASAADAIARGDLHATVEVRTRDEIGRLARSFNAMVESLTRSRAALEEKVAELERANRLKSEFLATVSHELRTPLNVIIGYVEMLADPTGGRLDEEQAKMIAAIERYSRLQLDLITNVLDFARLSSGQISFHVERFALAPLLAEIEALHARRLQNPRLALTVTVDPDLPMFETDRVKLQEIVHNLVDNAVKFAEAGRITLVARAGSDSSRVVIEVGDTGPGIPAEDLDTIFDAFHQVGESSTRRTSGVGLGLSIVKQLANALGGTVSVTSRIGEGSTFRVDVPCCLRAPGAPTPEAVPAVVAALDKVTRNVARLPRRPRAAGSRPTRSATK
jgi:signal transduction histidine kinase